MCDKMNWSNCSSNPEHNRKNFTIIVHGLILQPGDSLEKIVHIITGKKDGFYSASLVGYNETNPYLTNLKTYGVVGLILDVPEDAIYVAWPTDIGSPLNPEKLKEWAYANKGKRLAPEIVLSKYHEIPDLYNQLLIKGDLRARITGVYCNSTNEKAISEAKTTAELVGKLLDMKIPVVILPQQKKQEIANEDPRTAQLRHTLEALRRDNAVMESHWQFRRPDWWNDGTRIDSPRRIRL